jgi:pimeloyl-ACP methyl ester carboxylesterase
MKGWHYILLGIGALVGALAALYYVFPQVMVEPARSYVRGLAKLERKEISVGDHRVAYLEGGKGQTILLVHGFASNKDAWALLGKRLDTLAHVVALDLPGFGQSTRIEGADYGYEAQVERLHGFVKAMGLSKVHIGGHAMGAAIAAMYADAHPDVVETLALFAPAGVHTPTPSDYEQARKRGERPLRVETLADLDRVLSYLFVIQPEIPGVVKRGLVVEARRNAPFYEALGEKLLARGPSFLEPVLARDEKRTLLVWCEKDRLIDPSGAQVVRGLVKRARYLLLPGCGHVPQSERPIPVGQAYYEFITAEEG